MVAVAEKNPASQFANILFIFYQQNGLTAPRRYLLLCGCLLGGFLRAGKVYLERRAVPQFAVDPNITPALFDNSVNGRKPKTRPLTLLLSSKEGLKDTGLGLGVHAASCIAHRQHLIPTRPDSDVLQGVMLIEVDVGRFLEPVQVS